MPTINFMPKLNTRARDMVLSVMRNSENQKERVHEFFKYANESNQQSQALMSYYTQLNALRKGDAKQDQVEKIIDSIVNSDTRVKKEADSFVKVLNNDYPKTLGKRISILSQGAVKSDEVVPVSFSKRFMVKVNTLFDKLVEFCKPVE